MAKMVGSFRIDDALHLYHRHYQHMAASHEVKIQYGRQEQDAFILKTRKDSGTEDRREDTVLKACGFCLCRTTMDETKRKAEERRRKILHGARERLEKIGGRSTDTQQLPVPPSLPTDQPNVPTPAPAIQERAATVERPKQQRRRSDGLEKLSAALRMTRRERIATAVILACICSVLDFDSLSPFAWLTLNEVTRLMITRSHQGLACSVRWCWACGFMLG